MKSSNIWFAVAPLVVLASGCDMFSSGVPLDELASKTAKAYCTKLYECCAAAELPPGSTFGPDEATCEANLTTLQANKKTLISQGESQGRLAYHGDRLAQCLSELSQTSCAAMKSNATSQLPICNLYLEPRLDAGSACGLDEECMGGRCLGVGATDAGSDGACVLFVSSGASCALAPCGAGLFCHSGTSTCQVTKDDGASCNTNGECSTGGCNIPDAGGAGVCGLKGGAAPTCFATTGCGATGAFELTPVGLLIAAAVVVLIARRRRYGMA